MTAIAAVVSGRHGAMAGDSLIDCGGDVWVSAAAKVARRGPWLVGAAGDAPACVALLHTIQLPKPPTRNVASWCVATLPRYLLTPGEWCALLAVRGVLLYADHGGTVEPVARGWHAIGSGGGVAQGSLYTTQDGPLTCEQRAVLAVESARECLGSVGGPVRTARC